jgi:hypothetical protein
MVENETEIGDIPPNWNHLVDYDPPLSTDKISNLHYTIGGPYFEESKNCGYAAEWFAERQLMLSAIQIDDMRSVK